MNNSKAATVLATLAAVKRAEPSRRTFIAHDAARSCGTRASTPGGRAEGTFAHDMREKSGWPKQTSSLREEDDLYTLAEVAGITVTPAVSEGARIVPA